MRFKISLQQKLPYWLIFNWKYSFKDKIVHFRRPKLNKGIHLSYDVEKSIELEQGHLDWKIWARAIGLPKMAFLPISN